MYIRNSMHETSTVYRVFTYFYCHFPSVLIMPNSRSRSRSGARIPDTIDVAHIPGHGDRFRDTSTGRFVSDEKVVEVEYSMKGAGGAASAPKAQARAAPSHAASKAPAQDFSSLPIPETIEVAHIPGHGDRFRDASTGRFVADEKVVEVEYSLKGSSGASGSSSTAAARSNISAGARGGRSRSRSNSANRARDEHGRFLSAEAGAAPQHGQGFGAGSKLAASSASSSATSGTAAAARGGRDLISMHTRSHSRGPTEANENAAPQDQLKGSHAAGQGFGAAKARGRKDAIYKHTRSHSRGHSAHRDIGEQTYYYH